MFHIPPLTYAGIPWLFAKFPTKTILISIFIYPLKTIINTLILPKHGTLDSRRVNRFPIIRWFLVIGRGIGFLLTTSNSVLYRVWYYRFNAGNDRAEQAALLLVVFPALNSSFPCVIDEIRQSRVAGNGRRRQEHVGEAAQQEHQ